jgi:uncharacterized protein
MKYYEDKAEGIIVMQLMPGDLVLESYEQMIAEAGIDTAIVMTGIGSLSYGRLHVVVTNTLPPENKFFELEGPLELVSMMGIIADGKPHLHFGVLDVNNVYYGGHLEPGCKTLTLYESSVKRVPALHLHRNPYLSER